ncbi:MAG TPA: TIM-barrel domain-containing protein [Balneolales bacterium]|nr:TIM-barrel domain-containing protein [Balneolales bacterium]
MKNKRVVFVLILFLAAGCVSTFAQSGVYRFAGNLRSYKKVDNVVEVRLDNAKVRIAYLKGVGFRIRYSFTGKFGPMLSYATVEDMPPKENIKIEKNVSALLLKAGDEILRIQRSPFRITYESADGDQFMKDSFGAGHQGDKICHMVQRDQDEVYYGLGERPYQMNRAGATFTLWNTDHGGYLSGSTDPLYQSYPFYIGLANNKAYGVFYNNSYKTTFDFGGQLKTHIGYYSEGGELCYYVIYGPGIKEVLQKYTRLTGRAPLPPKWALGYQQSRYSYYPAEELKLIARQFRARKIPCDVLYLDIDYMHGYRDFTWNKNFFPHPTKMLSELKKEGFKVVTIIDPGIKKDSTYSVYNSGLEKNLYVKYPNGTNYTGVVWPGKVAFPDFSKNETDTWWGNLVYNWEQKGVSGVWLDMNEPSVFGGKTMPDIVLFNNDGHETSHLQMHNIYGLLEAKATYNGMMRHEPNKRPFILTRAGFSGTQRYAAMWTGDNVARWQDVGLTMPMVMAEGLAGEPFDGFDIGGFGGSPTGELYMRFLQIGVLMPFCRTHSSKGTVEQQPWDYGHMYTFINTKLIRFRYKILPDLYTAFYEHTQTGSPIIRPLVWDFQNDPSTYNINDQFMLGDHLMAAPVIHQGENNRTLYLPKGEWYGFFNDSTYSGGREITVPAPIRAVDTYNKIYTHPLQGLPLFVQAGSVIPMQEVQQYIGQKHITSMTLRVYNGASAKSELYEDDGHTQDYRHGQYRLTTFMTKSDNDHLDIDLKRDGTYTGGVSTFDVKVIGLHHAPQSTTVDGKSVDAHYDSDTGILEFKISADANSIAIQK